MVIKSYLMMMQYRQEELLKANTNWGLIKSGLKTDHCYTLGLKIPTMAQPEQCFVDYVKNTNVKG